jgi:hypothetical protein
MASRRQLVEGPHPYALDDAVSTAGCRRAPTFQLRNRRPFVRRRQGREGSSGRCAQPPLGSRTDGACPRLGTARRSVGARIMARGRLSSAGMAVATGTVVALRNLQRRWMPELRRRLSGHQRGTAVRDRCFSCMASSLHRVSSARWQLDSVAWDIALMASTSEGSSAASTHGR